MISKKSQKILLQYLQDMDEYLTPIMRVKIQTLSDSIDAYNTAVQHLKNEGEIVVSYNQKYLNPYYKIKTQSLKEITQIATEFFSIIKNKLDKDDTDDVDDFINSLIQDPNE